MNTNASSDRTLRDELVFLLRKGNAHMPLSEAVAGFPVEQMNTCPPNVPYTSWHLLEHIRTTQHDILDFITNPNYQEMRWPDDYWPPRDARTDAVGWDTTVNAILSDNEALQAIVKNPDTDLYAAIAWGTGQNILREMLVMSDHNAYHIGEFAILRQVMGTWRR